MSDCKLYIPISIFCNSFDDNIPKYIKILSDAGADRVYLCVPRCTDSAESKHNTAERLKTLIPIFENAGFEVGVWMSTLGHGGSSLPPDENNGKNGCTLLEAPDRTRVSDCFCPLDDGYIGLFEEWIQMCAEAGAKIIMLDDDYRMGFRGSEPLCCCDKHMNLISKKAGYKVGRGEIPHIFEGGPSNLRRAWLEAQGEGLLSLALKLRAALDKVNPDARLGHCAVLSTWELDGVDSLTLARAFAGRTKPFLRLIGAPYWAAMKNFGVQNLSTVIEYERMQLEWCKDSGMEIFSEGDVYPRPRYRIPSAYLELFDMGLRASGGFDGILKYMCDYHHLPEFEMGYLKRHYANLSRREWIEKHFDGLEPIGLTIFEPMKTLNYSHNVGNVNTRCIPASLRVGAFSSLPTKFSGGGINIICGDAAELACDEQLKDGAVLDARAAEILTRRGFDVGAESFGETIYPSSEQFPSCNDFEPTMGAFRRIELKAKAEPLSMLNSGSAGMYKYEDSFGRRFLVFAYTARDCTGGNTPNDIPNANESPFFGYCRQKIFFDTVEWITGKPLPVRCEGNPYLYIIAKANESKMSVALFNIFCDEVLDAEIKVADDYTRLEAFCGNATLENGVVKLPSIAPYGFAGFTVCK